MDELITIEEQYVQDSLNSMASRSLNEIVQERGFATLDEYYKAKQQWLFNELQFTEQITTSSMAFADIATILQNEQTVLLFEKHETPFIYHGDEPFNEEEAARQSIPVYEGGYMGGTIVGQIGDLSVGIFFPKKIEVRMQDLLHKISEILVSFGENAEVSGNDIMVDGQKAVGAAHLSTSNYYGFVAYISFTNKDELVERICGEATKKPGALTKLSVEEFQEALRTWLL